MRSLLLHIHCLCAKVTFLSDNCKCLAFLPFARQCLEKPKSVKRVLAVAPS